MNEVKTIQMAENSFEEYCTLDTEVCGGILFDNEGAMIVAKPFGLDKVFPDVTVKAFCDFSSFEDKKDYYFPSPFIWDMKYDSNNNILAAAQDRILEISSDGTVKTLIREDFNGFLGASGIELDKDGNIYVLNGGAVYKYSADLQKTLYIESKEYNSFFSISFSPDSKYLYLTDFWTKAIIRYNVNTDGTLGEWKEIAREPVKNSGNYGAPLNIIFDKCGNALISIDGMGHILVIDTDEKQSIINMNVFVRNHIIAFGGKGFDRDSIFFTTYGNKVCRLKMDGERAKEK